MTRGEKWRRVSARIERPVLSGRPGVTLQRLDRIVRNEPLASDPQEMCFLYHAVVLAAHYERFDLARSWIEAHEARRRGTPPLPGGIVEQYKVLRLVVELGNKDYPKAVELDREIGWPAILSIPWVYNMRLGMAFRRNLRSEILDLLRRPSPLVPEPPVFEEPADLGTRLTILGEFFKFRARLAKSWGYKAAARRHLAKDPCVDSRIREIGILVQGGSDYSRHCKLELAEAYLEQAIERARQVGHRPLERTARQELAWVCADRGDLARARALARQVARSAARSPGLLAHFQRVYAFIWMALFACEAGDLPEARSKLRKAEALLAKHEHFRVRAQFHTAKGRLLSLQGSRRTLELAFQEFEKAEELFRSRGEGDLLNIGFVCVFRGFAYLRAGRFEDALREVQRGKEIYKGTEPPRSEDSFALLQSHVLLSGKLPCSEALYEELLRKLPTVHNPIRLFQIIANLYLYTWDLPEGLDLTAQHLRQVDRLAEILDRKTFASLYERHLTRPVARRVLEKTFGLKVRELEEGFIPRFT